MATRGPLGSEAGRFGWPRIGSGIARRFDRRYALPTSAQATTSTIAMEIKAEVICSGYGSFFIGRSPTGAPLAVPPRDPLRLPALLVRVLRDRARRLQHKRARSVQSANGCASWALVATVRQWPNQKLL